MKWIITQKKAITFFVLLITAQAANAQRFWISPVASNWNNSANWSASSGGSGGSSVPVSGTAVFFDNLGTGNCNIDMPVSVLSLAVNAGYTGTITQGANTISIATTALFAGGIFTGGSSTITVTGVFTISGTAFTATSAILELRDNSAFTSGSFSHNNGILRLNANVGTQTLSGISPTLYTLELVGVARTYAISSTGSVVIVNSLNITGSLFYNLTGGAIDVTGDINITNSAPGCGGDATVTLNGTGTQTFTGNSTAGFGAIPKLIINKTSGILNLLNFPTVSNDFTYVAGAVNAGTSTVCFSRGTSATMIITGSLTLDNIAFSVNSSGLTATIAAGTTLTTTGDLLLQGAGNILIQTGTINVNGNVMLTNTSTGGGGTATINLMGTADQTIDGTSLIINQSRLPAISINKPSGTLFLANAISFSGNITYLAGIIDATTSTAYIVNTLTMTGSMSVYNLTFLSSGTTILTIASGSTITVTNVFTLGGISNAVLNTGTLAVQGDVMITNTATAGGGSGTILVNGTGAQSITSTGVVNQGRLPQVTIDKASGTLTFPALITVTGNWTYTTGTLDVTTNNSTIVFPAANTITGSHTLNNISFIGVSNPIFVIAPGTTITVVDMNISGSANVTLTTGTISITGNLNLSNTALAGGGTTVIAFVGSANQTITGSLLINQSRLPFITINKPSGTLTFPSLITVRGNWTYQAGTLDTNTNNSTIIFSNTLTISGDHTLNNITFDGSASNTFTLTGTTLSVAGNLSITGSNGVILTGGSIRLTGNLLLTNTNTGGGGTSVITFIASTDQSIISTLAVNQSNLPAVTINKPGGLLLFPALITVRGDWTYQTGVLDVTTNSSTIVFANPISTGAIALSGTHTLNNVSFEGLSSLTGTLATGTVLTVSGTLTTMGTANVILNTPVAATMAIQVQGDLVINNTATSGGGTAKLLINGTGAQTFTGNSASGQGKMPFITIQKTSGTLTLAGIISESRDWTYVSGSVDPSSSTVVFGGNALAISSAGMNFNNISIITSAITLSASLSANANVSISSGVLSPGTNTINLKGNWTNYGTGGFTEATSTVNFNGNTTQSLATTGGENLTNMTINNAGAGVQLSSATTVSAMFTMTQGNLNLNGNVFTLGTSITIRGTLARTAGTVFGTGSFRRWFNTTTTVADGAVAGLFPMGTVSDYRPLSLSMPVTGPTTGGSVNVSHTGASTVSVVSFSDGASTVARRQDSFWTMATTSLAGGTYNLRGEGTGFGIIGSVADVRLTLISSVAGTAGTNSGNTLTPQVNRTGLTLSNLSNSFYIGSVNAVNTPLPITLLSFTVQLNHGVVKINWETAMERDNNFFTVQRSGQGSAWEKIEEVDGAGTAVDNTSYTVEDQFPYAGISYYRLKQTDFDGKESYSAVRKCTNGNEPFVSIVLYPNPASDEMTVVLTESVTSTVWSIVLRNTIGQIMTVPLQLNSAGAVLQLSSLKEGIYFIQLNSGDFTATRKVMISR